MNFINFAFWKIKGISSRASLPGSQQSPPGLVPGNTGAENSARSSGDRRLHESCKAINNDSNSDSTVYALRNSLRFDVSMYDSLCLASAGLSFEDEMSCDTVLVPPSLDDTWNFVNSALSPRVAWCQVLLLHRFATPEVEWKYAWSAAFEEKD